MEIDYIKCGDCLELMKELPDKSIDMILCDLPYGTTRNKWDSVIDLEDLWTHYERVIKDTGAIVLFSQMPFTAELAHSNLKLFRYEWIWEKTQMTGFLNAKKMPLKSHENILIFYKQLPTYNPQKTQGHIRKISSSKHKQNCKLSSNYNKHNLTSYDSTERYPKSVITFKKDTQKSRLHPTQKPVALLEYLIKTYTNESEVVLDNCMGSGSTGVACINTNRHYIGYELRENYYDIACKRLDEAKNKYKEANNG